MQELAKLQTIRSIMFYMNNRVQTMTGFVPAGAPMSSQTSFPGRFQTSLFPIKHRAFFMAVSLQGQTDVNTPSLSRENDQELDLEKRGIRWSEWGANTLFQAWGEYTSMLCISHIGLVSVVFHLLIYSTSHTEQNCIMLQKCIEMHIFNELFSWPFHGATQGMQVCL